MEKVRPKKALGQHFLTDKGIAADIAAAVTGKGYKEVLEVGPGMGMLTEFLLQRKDIQLWAIEIDPESVDYLERVFPLLSSRIIKGDFLQENIAAQFEGKFAVAGNFPYNISSQIMFRAIEWKDQVQEVVGMFQKEVAKRLVSGPGNKDYGILSVLLQAWYTGEYLFDVPPHVFNPPPKVQSGVIRFVRNEKTELGCDESLFKSIVKMSFNQRRKQLRNSIKALGLQDDNPEWNKFATKRPEQLNVEDFIELTLVVEKFKSGEAAKPS